ncbi:unnamed protein product [Plutella xylostella]|uniref:(diamondback moth) hypothetical protein n=1 Tax=Plutella xylostella TaxID=51655 RepID=A0A8S4FMG6_PLUXY|nr:unnamed protein product [Plutella xylostella]
MLIAKSIEFGLLRLPNDLTVYWHQYPYSLGVVFCKLRALISEA